MIDKYTKVGADLLFTHSIENAGNTTYTLKTGQSTGIGSFYCINDGANDVVISFPIGDSTKTVTVKFEEGIGFPLIVPEKGVKFTITASTNYRLYFFSGV